MTHTRSPSPQAAGLGFKPGTFNSRATASRLCCTASWPMSVHRRHSALELVFYLYLLPWTLKISRTGSSSPPKEEAVGVVQSMAPKRGHQPVLNDTEFLMCH